MIKHIVCWKVKDNLDTEKVCKEIKEKLIVLKETISQLKSIEVGINSIEASHDNFDVVLISEFSSFDDLETYQAHPDHIKAGIFIRSVTEKRVAIDYEY